jgi:hypothetical protein
LKKFKERAMEMMTDIQAREMVLRGFNDAKQGYDDAYRVMRDAEERLAKAKAVLEEERKRVAMLIQNAMQVPVSPMPEEEQGPYPTELETRPGQYTRPSRM